MRVSVAFAIGLGRYLCGFAEFIELRLKASTRLNHGRIIWMRRAACHARFGSFADIGAINREVRSAPTTGLMQCSNLNGYSITSSARARSVGGIVRPSVLAVFKLIANSNLVGSSMGKSVGLVPFTTRAA